MPKTAVFTQLAYPSSDGADIQREREREGERDVYLLRLMQSYIFARFVLLKVAHGRFCAAAAVNEWDLLFDLI